MTLNWTNIKSAFIYGVLSVVFGFIFSASSAVLDHGSFFGLDWKHIFDTSAIYSLGIFVSTISVVKNLLTDDKGLFLGVLKVIPENKK